MKNNEDMTIAEVKAFIAKADALRELLGMPMTAKTLSTDTRGSHSFVLGEKVFIRTVTHYYTGLVESITDTDLVLSTAAWITDTGRFTAALKDGFPSNAEIEVYPSGCVVHRGAVVDHCKWIHDLPTKQR